MKKLFYKSLSLICALTMFATTPVFAAETTENRDEEIVYDEEREYWENVEWDTFDLKGYENEVKEMQAREEAESGISLMYLEEVGGTWIQASDGRWWYRHTDGSYTTNSWEKIGGCWYYFDANGWMVTGWLQYNGNWFYLDPVTGIMQVGWITVNGKSYYMETTYGAMLTGWICPNGTTWYYCNESTGEWIDNTGTRMIQEAFKYVGGKYVYGGNNLATGVDCSGYVQQISLLYGISTPRTSSAQYASSTKVSYSNLQPGDLVFFSSSSGSSTVSHVAFYVGRINGQDDMIVHAANSSSGIIISSMRSNIVGCGTYWR